MTVEFLSAEEDAIVRASLCLDRRIHRREWLYVMEALQRGPKGRTAHYVRKLRTQLTDLLRESGIEQPMSDERIIEIRDELLPSQGEAFDTIAFARAILKARGLTP